MLKEYTDTERKRPALSVLLKESRAREAHRLQLARRALSTAANSVQKRSAEFNAKEAGDRIQRIDRQLAQLEK